MPDAGRALCQACWTLSLWLAGDQPLPDGADPFPIRLIDGTSIPLAAGDDVQTASQAGDIDEMRLRVNVANIDETEGIVIKVNGVVTPAESIERPAAEYFEAVLAAPPLQRGINEIVILPGPNCVGRLSSTVTDLELSLGYRHD